jgi:hypothetical protein
MIRLPLHTVYPGGPRLLSVQTSPQLLEMHNSAAVTLIRHRTTRQCGHYACIPQKIGLFRLFCAVVNSLLLPLLCTLYCGNTFPHLPPPPSLPRQQIRLFVAGHLCLLCGMVCRFATFRFNGGGEPLPRHNYAWLWRKIAIFIAFSANYILSFLSTQNFLLSTSFSGILPAPPLPPQQKSEPSRFAFVFTFNFLLYCLQCRLTPIGDQFVQPFLAF